MPTGGLCSDRLVYRKCTMTHIGQPGTGGTSTMPERQDSALSLGPATWHATVAYDGTAFRGWQIQPNQRTVQGELEKRIRLIFRQPDLRLSATSRTDAGVHALDQHVSFAAPQLDGLSPEHVRQTLNRWLPPDIQVRSVDLAEPEFHARFDATGKAYTYVIHTGEKCHPLFSRFTWRLQRELDPESMQEAADHLVGEHDFASFAVNPKREISTTVRRLDRVEVRSSGDLVFVNVVGRSFLYKMVRSIAGFLLRVGVGELDVKDARRLLKAAERTNEIPTAKPLGLFLWRVDY